MEPAKIDWETIDSVFIKDDLYEHIKAPKWVDFSAPFDNALLVADDQSWFCRPDCNHPKTVEDLLLLKVDPKVQRPTTVSETLPMGDQNRRDANLKRRPGFARPLLSSKKGTKSDKFVIEDGENVNPNLHSTPSHQYNHMKSVIRSSTEKKNKSNKKENDSPHRQKLKSTLSARNLFGGRDIVNHISEFCNELKRLAMRTKEREILLEKEEEKRGESLGKKNTVVEEDEVKVGSKNRKVEETENAPPTSVDLKLKKKKNSKDVAAIATCPPSPQCFSAGRGPTTATLTPPLKPASRSRLQVRGILQELDQKNKKLSKEEELVDHNTSPVVLEREGPAALDVFWFLKPCTNLSS